MNLWEKQVMNMDWCLKNLISSMWKFEIHLSFENQEKNHFENALNILKLILLENSQIYQIFNIFGFFSWNKIFQHFCELLQKEPIKNV